MLHNVSFLNLVGVISSAIVNDTIFDISKLSKVILEIFITRTLMHMHVFLEKWPPVEMVRMSFLTDYGLCSLAFLNCSLAFLKCSSKWTHSAAVIIYTLSWIHLLIAWTMKFNFWVIFEMKKSESKLIKLTAGCPNAAAFWNDTRWRPTVIVEFLGPLPEAIRAFFLYLLTSPFCYLPLFVCLDAFHIGYVHWWQL